ncbi:MAG: MmcQ/YjbR family DNA-binding protein [Ignavibacteriales bacterium]|nr:MmcQ/YjbR family DNA-binding protein [Ignavibacteriales bacterium]
MDIEKVRNYCIKKKMTSEGFPFGEEVLVFKVMNKMFCLANLTPPYTINLKCDPEYAVELREKYSAVTAGYHMNKIHWNTIFLDGSIPDKEILSWIDHSYELIVASLPKKDQLLFKKK